jgi:hypothetical protein
MAIRHNRCGPAEDGESSSALAIGEFNVRESDGPAVLRAQMLDVAQPRRGLIVMAIAALFDDRFGG